MLTAKMRSRVKITTKHTGTTWNGSTAKAREIFQGTTDEENQHAGAWAVSTVNSLRAAS